MRTWHRFPGPPLFIYDYFCSWWGLYNYKMLLNYMEFTHIILQNSTPTFGWVIIAVKLMTLYCLYCVSDSSCASIIVVIAASAIRGKTSGYLVVANRLYLHHISLDGSRSRVVVSGLSSATGVDFEFRDNSLYWTDSSRQAIMKSTIEGLKKHTLLDRGLTRPGNYTYNTASCYNYWTFHAVGNF